MAPPLGSRAIGPGGREVSAAPGRARGVSRSLPACPPAPSRGRPTHSQRELAPPRTCSHQFASIAGLPATCPDITPAISPRRASASAAAPAPQHLRQLAHPPPAYRDPGASRSRAPRWPRRAAATAPGPSSRRGRRTGPSGSGTCRAPRSRRPGGQLEAWRACMPTAPHATAPPPTRAPPPRSPASDNKLLMAAVEALFKFPPFFSLAAKNVRRATCTHSPRPAASSRRPAAPPSDAAPCCRRGR
jgi:hypothetical protein